MSITSKKIAELEKKANEIRQSIIESLLEAGSGHTAGPLGMTDIFTVLYFHSLRHDPKNPDRDDRDRVVLSNGHICPVLYATMAHSGYFPLKELKTLRKFGTRLQGHPHREYLPGIETSSGPLGSGLSQATGMALSDRIMRESKSTSKEGESPEAAERFFYCFMGDGELNAGNIWEAAMLAGKERLYNLIGIIDRNNIQIDGFTEDIMPLEPLKEKWESWNWHVQEINGHNILEIINAIEAAKTYFSRPSVMIANTIPGKGVHDFERKYEWHGKPPNKEEAKMALKELRSLGGKIRPGHHD